MKEALDGIHEAAEWQPFAKRVRILYLLIHGLESVVGGDKRTCCFVPPVKVAGAPGGVEVVFEVFSAVGPRVQHHGNH